MNLHTTHQLLLQARQFYKHGLKSSNKMYVDVSTSRKLARNRNSPIADAEIHYSTQALAKLEGWDQQGKNIVSASAVNADGIPMPTATIVFRQWWTQLVTQPLKYLEQ